MTDIQKRTNNEWTTAIAERFSLPKIEDPYVIEGTLGLEGVTLDMPKFTSYVTGFMDGICDIFKNPGLIPIPFIRSDLDVAVIRLSKQPRIRLDYFTVVAPEYLSKDFPEYLQTLQDVLTQLLTIEKRLLQPIEIWCEKMLGEKDFAEKAWVMLPGLTDEVQVHQDTLKGYFNGSVGKGIDNKKFYDMYSNVPRFKESSLVIDELNKLAQKALGGKLHDRAKNISYQIDRINKKEKLVAVIKTLPEGKIATISALTYECAKQMEMMAIVLYQIRVAGQAFKETVQKINKEL